MKNRILLIPLALLLALSLVAVGCPVPVVDPVDPVDPVEVHWPTRPITLIVCFAAGGGTDIGARLLTPHVEALLGQPIKVVNITGGGGWVGWTMLAKAKPDGYTIGYLNTPALQVGYLNPDLANPFNLESFSAITNHVLDYGVVAVRADSPFMTMEELVDYAVRNPGKLSFTTTGAMGDDHLRLLAIEDAVPGAEFKAVHGRGAADSIALVLGGHTDILAVNVGEVLGLERDGKVRTLAVSALERSHFLPDVPTLYELGYGPVVNYSARGIGAPAGVPPHILEKLAEAFKEGMRHPEHVAAMEEVGLALQPMLLDEYFQFLKEEEMLIRRLLGW